MKFNKKKLRTFFATSFILITVATFTSCKQVNSIALSEQPNPITNSIVEEIDTTEKGINTPYPFIDMEIDTELITDTTEYFLDNLNELEKLNKITKEQQLLAVYAYKKLITANISQETFENELNNIMVEQTTPRCISDEAWEEYFGEISKTLEEHESLSDTFLTLAWLIHDFQCNENHEYVNSSIKCKSLINQFSTRYSK
jgi:hypothetical protein